MSYLNILEYLETTDTLTASIKEKLTKYLEVGYQKLLNYFRYEKSFSIFGEHDLLGSTALTAFAVRILKKMGKYVFVDSEIINQAINWIFSVQLDDGCFNPAQSTFYKMTHTTVTAHVIISFLESGIDMDHTVLSKAKQCILKDKASRNQILAISAYALQFLNSTDAVESRLEKLMKSSKSENNLKRWSDSCKKL